MKQLPNTGINIPVQHQHPRPASTSPSSINILSWNNYNSASGRSSATRYAATLPLPLPRATQFEAQLEAPTFGHSYFALRSVEYLCSRSLGRRAASRKPHSLEHPS
ncbi:hypothetical protein CEP54_009021 [Fusarium duplospermum]|uniref:Uncharacterized protein n=1 Tax=Fusarium duplospermum TaxID=1325734 RepID=A0A428PT16_9HYPO|nr:hypothetical protein CEP54_009021 [Fusarium duplospermum]